MSWSFGVCHGRVASRSREYGVWCMVYRHFFLLRGGWGFLLSLTWKLAPLDGQSDGGETLGEELRLCGLA